MGSESLDRLGRGEASIALAGRGVLAATLRDMLMFVWMGFCMFGKPEEARARAIVCKGHVSVSTTVHSGRTRNMCTTQGLMTFKAPCSSFYNILSVRLIPH